MYHSVAGHDTNSREVTINEEDEGRDVAGTHIDFGEYLMVKKIIAKDAATKNQNVLKKTSTLYQIKSNLMIL